jgi:dTDP-4-dehydrorhamnose reductase
MGKKLAECAGLDPGLIKECSQKDITMAARRPRDVSLTSTPAMAVGYNPGTFEKELSRLDIVRTC